MEQVQLPSNFKKNVRFVVDTYTGQGIAFSDGFQKDIIQNAMGARPGYKFNNWSCRIDLIDNEKGRLLIIEDEGTVGLTGPNLSMTEIARLSDKEEEIPATCRLARFSSLFNSGGNETGGGLFGIGKMMYTAASDSYTYCFDSLTTEGNYVANKVESGKINERAFEGQEAKDFILRETGLTEKTSVGTRIVIFSPNKEIADDITSGKIKDYIRESWWILMKRMNDDSGIYVNGEKVAKFITPEYENSFDLEEPFEYRPDYSVKHFGFYVAKDSSCPFTGFAYYRKGMKIGEVDIREAKIPEKIANRYWGYIEVDDRWEKELAEIENNIHYGINKGKKRSVCYQNLRNYSASVIHDCLVKWKYIKETRNDDAKLNEELQDIARDIQSLFSSLSMPKLGQGDTKDDFEVRLSKITFPEPSKTRVTEGDSISFSVLIKNRKMQDMTFNYEIITSPVEDKMERHLLRKNSIDVSGTGDNRFDYSYVVDGSTARNEAENLLIVIVKPQGSRKKIEKTIPFCFNCDKEKTVKETVFLSLHSCRFPRKDSRRVDPNDYLTNLTYRIENRRNEVFPFVLSVSLHNGSGEKDKIMDIARLEGSIDQFEETVVSIPDILFDPQVIEQHLDKGPLELRARVIANGDSGDYMKGDRITAHKLVIYYATDAKNGFENSFEIISRKEPDNHRRSWNEISGSSRYIVLNIGHVAFEAVKGDEEEQREYCKEQMLRQFVLLYLREGKYDIFGLTQEDLENIDPVDLVDKVSYEIEYVYRRSLG